MTAPMEGLVFGWRSATLTVVIVQLLMLAAALTRPLANRVANRTLAALLVVLAGIVTPWAIGFAGLYDRWRWLTFAPFQITLAVAPLLWLYATALTTGRWPARGWRHLMPAGVQFAYLFASFLLPLPLKDRWADISYAAVGRTTDLLTVVGLAVYGLAGLRLLRRYRILLADQRSDDARFAGRWLARALVAAALLLPIWAGYVSWDAVDPLGYKGLMGQYLAIAAFALFLGIEGWRHAALPFPHLAAVVPEPAPRRDWRAQGEAWACGGGNARLGPRPRADAANPRPAARDEQLLRLARAERRSRPELLRLRQRPAQPVGRRRDRRGRHATATGPRARRGLRIQGQLQPRLPDQLRPESFRLSPRLIA